VHTKPILATKAKTGKTMHDVKGKVTQWSDVVRPAALPVPQISTAHACDDDDMTAPSHHEVQPDLGGDVPLSSDAVNMTTHACSKPTIPPAPVSADEFLITSSCQHPTMPIYSTFVMSLMLSLCLNIIVRLAVLPSLPSFRLSGRNGRACLDSRER
jgi:hypothetical protein